MTQTVAASSPAWATQLRLLQRQLLARITAGAGPGVVTALPVRWQRFRCFSTHRFPSGMPGSSLMICTCTKSLGFLTSVTAELIDELYHGTFFNEKRRVESVLAHAALGGRLVHGCQSVPNMAGGCVVAYGTDINVFYDNLHRLKQDWISQIENY